MVFGRRRRLKYRNEVMAELHAILHFIQDKERLLLSLGSLDKAITELEQNRATELEAAIVLSLLAIKRLVQHIPQETRNTVVRQLGELGSDHYRRFRDVAQPLGAVTTESLDDTQTLTLVAGFAFWYLGAAVRQNTLPQDSYDHFVSGVMNLLHEATGNEDQQVSAV